MTRAGAPEPSPPPRPPPGTLRLVTPASWYDLDLVPRTRRASIRAEVQARVGPDPSRAEVRRGLTALLLRASSEAAERGAVAASMYSEVIDGTAVSASLVAMVQRGDGSDGGDGDADLAALAARLNAEPGGPQGGPQGGPGEAVVVELLAGPAVRLRGRHRAHAGRQSVEVESTQFLIPVDGTGVRVVLNFSTPSLRAAAAFAELFDAIAKSVGWSYPPGPPDRR